MCSLHNLSLISVLLSLPAIAGCDGSASSATPTPTAVEHAVIVELRLSDDAFGTTDDFDAMALLSDKLAAAIEPSDLGEFDGNEIGAGVCTLYMYGPDADALYAAIEPILKASKLAKGGAVTKRYGEAGDPNAKEVKSQL